MTINCLHIASGEWLRLLERLLGMLEVSSNITIGKNTLLCISLLCNFRKQWHLLEAGPPAT